MRAVIGSVIGSLLALGSAASAENVSPLAELTERDRLTIVVTDSGLGGLSVLANIARRAEETRTYEHVDLIFYNALFREQAGYNSLATRDEKVRIFNNALEDMGARFAPDAILVACNTLSVLLPDCAAARRGTPPVVGIVEPGVELLAEALGKHPEASAILFATQTTVEEDTHRQGLLARGIADERIVMQPCADLTWYIEQDPGGFETELMIGSFVAEALAKRASADAPVFASFNCTHFGYSSHLWQEAMEGQGAELMGMLNPNTTMAAPLFPSGAAHRHETTTVTARMVSQVPIEPQVVEALGRALAPESPKAAEALAKWEHIPNLFAWEQE
jgi:glutamate racemase